MPIALRSLFPRLSQWTHKLDVKSPVDGLHRKFEYIPAVTANILPTMMRGALVAADHLASSNVGATIRGEGIHYKALQAYVDTLPNWNGWTTVQNAAAEQGVSALLIAPTGSGKTEAALRWMVANRKKHERIFYVLPYQVSINSMAQRLCKVFPDGDDG